MYLFRLNRVAALAVLTLGCDPLALRAQPREALPASPAGYFEIARFDVQGNTLLSDRQIEQALAPFTGKKRDFASVGQAVAALQATYRHHGYRLVHVVLPEQKLDHGVVRLAVIEGKIGKVTVAGNQHFSDTNIRRSVPELMEGGSPNFNDISASLKLANENPAKNTTLQLQSADTNGQVAANLQVTDAKPWVASLGVDSTGDAHTGRNRLTAEYQNSDVGGLDHVLSVEYSTSLAHPDDVSVYGAAYHVPLYALGDSVDVYGSYSDVNSGVVSVGPFDLAISGKGLVAGARYNHELPRLGDYDSKLIAGFDYKAFHDDVSLAGTPLGNDVTVHPVSVTYTGSWMAAGNTVNFYLSLSHNIPGGDNGGSADVADARTHATDNYTILRYGASYLRVLPLDWQIRLAFNGQYTHDALVLGEQFGVGGMNSVRGFDERELADDRGGTTNVEFYTPNFCPGRAQCRVLAFYDNGYVARNDALPGEIRSESIGSTGLGLRMTFDRYVTLQADYAHVLDGSELTAAGSHRIQFRALVSY